MAMCKGAILFLSRNGGTETSSGYQSLPGTMALLDQALCRIVPRFAWPPGVLERFLGILVMPESLWRERFQEWRKNQQISPNRKTSTARNRCAKNTRSAAIFRLVPGTSQKRAPRLLGCPLQSARRRVFPRNRAPPPFHCRTSDE